MPKTILITGSTDGIGLETARALIALGHRVLLHGRSATKLEAAEKSLVADAQGAFESYLCDLSRPAAVAELARSVTGRHDRLDVLINNAGVFMTPDPVTPEGLDARFAVNTLAPCLLTQRLLPLLGASARVINLSSAAQAPVDLEALAGKIRLSDDFTAYAQSKLALTIWSRSMALSLEGSGPAIIAVNPGSMLGSKMVQEGFGVAGKDIRIGSKILTRAALDDAFAAASGQYFDNDSGRFAPPHPDVLDAGISAEVVRTIEAVLAEKLAETTA